MTNDNKAIELGEEIKQALLKLAEGYTVQEKFVTLDEQGNKTIKIKEKHVPPSIKAIEQIMYYKYLGKW